MQNTVLIKSVNPHGVRHNPDRQYYQKVASTYRNPFFPGIKKVITRQNL